MKNYKKLYNKIEVTYEEQEMFFVKVWFEIFCAGSYGEIGAIQSNMLANKKWFTIQFKMVTDQFLLDTRGIDKVDANVYVDYVKNHFSNILPYKKINKLEPSKYNLN